MSQPPPYSPSHSFVSDSATLPNFPGQALDIEFNNISAVTGAIEADLSLIQRDDGALENGVVTYDSLSVALQANGLAPANPWVTATSYQVGTGVIQSSSLYRCLIAHTSTVFATDLASGDWILVSSLAFGAGTNIALTGSTFSLSTSPVLTTPNLGVATATSINGNTFTSGTYTLTGVAGKTFTFSNTLTLAGVDGKTLTVNNSLTMAGTDATTMTFPPTSASIARTDAGQTFTGTQIFGAITTTTINGGSFPGAILTGVRLAKTGAYPVVSADIGSTIALGGAAFYTLTFNAASGYSTPFAVRVVNEDTARGKRIACNGLTSFILYPGQSVVVENQNNVWEVYPAFQRWAIGGLNLYVDPAGSDSNDGLASGTANAFLTISKAVTVLYQSIDCQNSAPTINLAAGTFTESVAVQGQTEGVNFFKFVGAGSASTTWKPGASGFCLTVSDNGEAQVQAIKFDNTSGSNNCIGLSVHQDGVIDVLTDINFGTFPTGGGASRHINSDQGGFINMPASYTISGAANWHMNIGPGTVVSQTAGGTITLSGTFTLDLLYRLTGCFMTFAGVESYSIGTATVTKKYAVDFLGALQLNGTTVIGTGAGTTTNGAVAA